ncbi:MAG: NADH-quinone oxidoreductase subunit H [Opitutaceae bacterium]|nr:NADH-quinone oxidoreductase subunit H [Cytophagales bacterium]
MIGFLLVILSSTFFNGIVFFVRAKLSGREGPGVFQSFKDIVRLAKKGNVFSHTTSYIFQLAPIIYFASIITAMLVVPFGNKPGFFSFEGDFVFFVYILALGKFFLMISAMDTGSPFEGMGANREAVYGLLAEPAFFILIGSFSMLTGHFSFYNIYNSIHFGNSISYFMGGLVTYILIQIAMLECGRMPVDDSKTNNELTMIQEAMVLDNSGFDLALIQTGTLFKFSLYGLLIANFFLPPNTSLVLNISLFLVIQILLAVMVGFLESFRARSRMNRNPLIIFNLTALSILIFFAVLIIMNKFSL